jgi:polysaccharide deacetylase family protein (PEP-CTERM system associated)
VGSHGLSHALVHTQTPDEFRTETREARLRLEELLGEPVRGFRAPEFSIVRSSWWALEVLADEGFAYDCSVYPMAGRRYGVPGFALRPVTVQTPAGPIVQVPMTVLRAGGCRFPAMGGGWLRFLPYAWHRRALRQAEEEGRPGVLYLHPYEFAESRLAILGPLSPRRRLALLRYSWVHNRCRRQLHDRFLRLLREFRFGSVTDVLSHYPPRLHG